jgi:ABC-type polysaccharide/polyol phosphate export permease
MTAYLLQVWHYRRFVLTLTRFDLRARYKGTVLGLGWTLLHPLAMTAILCILFYRVFQMPLCEYAPFLLVGLVCWQFIASNILQRGR